MMLDTLTSWNCCSTKTLNHAPRKLSARLLLYFGPWASKGWDKVSLDFEIFSKKGCFLSFAGEKSNFTTFGPPGKNPFDVADKLYRGERIAQSEIPVSEFPTCLQIPSTNLSTQVVRSPVSTLQNKFHQKVLQKLKSRVATRWYFRGSAKWL